MDFRTRNGSAKSNNTIVSYFRLISFLMILSVLIQTSTTAPASTKSSSQTFDLIENPCNWMNGHKIRHQRSTKDTQAVRTEVNKTRHFTNNTLSKLKKMYGKLQSKPSVPFKRVKVNERVKSYYGLQMFMKSIDMMSKQEFVSSDKINKKKRSTYLSDLYNRSNVLLCEMYDDIHHHNLTKKLGSEVLEMPMDIPNEIDRSALKIQDLVVLKNYKRFLSCLLKFYKLDSKTCERKNGKGNKVKRKNGNKEKRIPKGNNSEKKLRGKHKISC